MTDNEKLREKVKEDQLAREIGQRILEARTGLGWSQQALHTRTKLHDSEGIGISRAVLSLYETGVNKPGAREIRILCETLKITGSAGMKESPLSRPKPARSSFMSGHRGCVKWWSERARLIQLCVDSACSTTVVGNPIPIQESKPCGIGFRSNGQMQAVSASPSTIFEPRR